MINDLDLYKKIGDLNYKYPHPERKEQTIYLDEDHRLHIELYHKNGKFYVVYEDIEEFKISFNDLCDTIDRQGAW